MDGTRVIKVRIFQEFSVLLFVSDLSYSTKSDVWSFGILITEILNRTLPHANLDMFTGNFSDKFIKLTIIFLVGVEIRDNGITPAVPDNTPQWLLDLLKLCWSINPDDRPNFDVLSEILEKNVN